MSKKVSRMRNLLAKQQGGFTLLEVLVAFTILVVILAGMTTALTSAMQLNTTQRERSLAQDMARDVVAKYVKTVKFDDPSSTTGDLTPYDEGTSMASTYSTGFSRVLYDGSVSPAVNNLEPPVSPVNLKYMIVDLVSLNRAKLELLIYPIKNKSCTSCTESDFFTSKVNVVTRLRWDNDKRMIEIPTVVGSGDVTRADRDSFIKPTAPPSSTPCTSTGLTPVTGSSCCTGLTLVNSVCVAATCTPAGQRRSDYSGLACCTGSTADAGGTCIADPTCTVAGANMSTTGGLACCAGSTADGAGLCVANATCTPAGGARSAYSNAPCCSGTTESSGQCVAACSTAGQTPPSGGSCCSGLVLNSATSTCITCITGGNTPPLNNATLCCSGQVNTHGANAGQCKNN